MNRSTGIAGGTENAVDSIEPLEPGRPDVIPPPPVDDIEDVGGDDDIPLEPDDEAPLEKDVEKVERNNTFVQEHPGEI
jgi:hypothetical protein